ncbi:hypothetical protein ACIOEW_13815 [Streptomyces sp. NPDC087901]|uniref:hypothetical protein n=1 Tax=Streptomyces sp. NPDC087901 TaxID=3365818 RepID=UPI0037F23FAA
MTAPLTSAPAPTTPATSATPPSPVRGAAIGGVIGGLVGAVMSAGVNYAVIGLPDSESLNAVNHAISGLLSGFFAGFVGLLIHSRKAAAAARTAETRAASAIPRQAEPADHSTATAPAEAPVSAAPVSEK